MLIKIESLIKNNIIYVLLFRKWNLKLFIIIIIYVLYV